MSSGYVLNFSDKTFQEFVFESSGIDIYAPGMDAGGTSKAKRLRHFLKTQPDHIAGRLLLALCDYYRVSESQPDQNLLSHCRGIAERLTSSQDALHPQNFGPPYQPSTPPLIQTPVPHPPPVISIATQSSILLTRFEEMAHSSDAVRRGYLLENLLIETFKLHQIDVVRSFRRNNNSEQIDAAFKLEGWHYLVECRWREKLADTRQVDGLRGQVQRSGKQTMGVFFSVNGWSAHVPGNLKQNPDKSVLLMDGYDLRVVLEGRIGLRELLLAKLTHFNIESEPFVSVQQVLSHLA
ncbi:MAG TPA: hypothetical protein VHZ52_00245 [Acidobacteriaceae bacterium]|nr:hypothetical protein [Acidobacteriaceae bacterium]